MSHVQRYYPHQDRSKYYFCDNFFGFSYNQDVWAVGGLNGSVYKLTDAFEGGVVRINILGAEDNNQYMQHIAGGGNFKVSNNAEMVVRAKLYSTQGVYMDISLATQSNTKMTWKYSSVAGTSNYQAMCEVGGTQTTTTTSIAADTDWHKFHIISKSGEVKFLLDDVLEATITTNIPSGAVSPRLWLYGNNGITGGRSLDIDWVKCYGKRAT